MTPQERKTWIGMMGARGAWWDLRREAILEPDWECVDTHFHLWKEQLFPDPQEGTLSLRTSRYLLDEFLDDACAGHKVTQAVYVECGSEYRTEGPSNLRVVGETEFAARLARQQASSFPQIGAIIAHADLRDPDLPTVLDAHREAGGSLFRGVRQSGARLEDPAARLIAGAAPPGLYADPAFRRGLALLGDRGLIFDSFQFHFQLEDLEVLARSAPGTVIVVDHLGAPVDYSLARAEDQPAFRPWAKGVEALARLPNVVMKLGGMASIVTGYDGHRRETPPSSEEFVDERGGYFRHAISCFGPERCMFESNFPVDSTSIGYVVLWNAYKRIAAEHPADARRALLCGTARRVYGMNAGAAAASSPERRS